MTARLPDHLDLIATAPDGIRKLRGLILELAVRGKLVPQDANDEPASELLKRVTAERAALATKGGGKSLKHLPAVANDEQPFTLPARWEWTRLGELVLKSGAGWSPSCESRPRQGNEWGVLKVSAVSWGEFKPDENKALPENLAPRPEHEVALGDFLISRANTAELVARSVVVESCPDRLMLSDKIVRLKLSQFVDGRFINITNSCAQARDYYARVAGGTSSSMKNVSREQILNLVVPLPPLTEQHRIVAKVDELMLLCDRMEAEQADAETAHARLVETLLGTLTQSADADELAANWQHLAEHFESLFETPSAVAALRKTILNLALDGRLVRQSAPAEMCAISTLIEGDSLNGCSKRPSDTPCGVQILRISAGTGNDDFFVDENDHKWIEVTPAQVEKFRLLPDDLLACRFNGNLHYVGSFSLYRGQSAAPQIFPDKLIRFRVQHHKVLANYLRYALNADSVRVQVEGFCATTVGNIGISAGNLKTVKVRIPELDEQHRIVAKVDELLALCDRLKADLVDARTRQARLADTLIDAALAAA